MKDNDKLLNDIADIESPYFLGSALLMSLFPIIENLRAVIVCFDKLYPDFDKSIHDLLIQDSLLFSKSKVKELDTSSWNEVIEAITNYTYVVQSLNEIYSLCIDIKKINLSNILKRDNLMLKHLLQYSLSHFFELENKPEEFSSICANALYAIRGNYEEKL